MTNNKEVAQNSKNIFLVLLAPFFLWVCIWATYNTDIFRIFSPGFPHNPLDLMHGLRSFLPFIAIILSAVFLLKKRSLPRKFFWSPLGLLSIYTIVGIFSSVFSKNPLGALYWSILYGSVIIVLLAILVSSNPIKKLSLVCNINWTIAGVIALSLLLFFLIQPGVISSLTYNILVCSQRPYEGLGGASAMKSTFGMAGTRPTGLGRYAGIAAIVALASFFYSKKRLKIIWFFVFIIFLLILLFSKGKTEIFAFIIAMIFVILLSRRINIFSVLLACAVSLLSVFIIFYNVPCTNSLDFITYFVPHISFGYSSAPKNLGSTKLVSMPEQKFSGATESKPVSVTKPVSATKPVSITMPVSITEQKPPTAPKLKNVQSIVSLSGRISGVWLDSWHLFLTNPLTGFGFQADRFFLNGQHTHNSILHALVQTGILGTVPFVMAFILTFLILWKLFKKPDTTGKSFLIGISAVLVFIGIRSVTESVAFFSADWLFVAPIIAYIQCLGNDSDRKAGNCKEKPVLNFLGNKIDIITKREAVGKISYWIRHERSRAHWIVVTGMHGIVEAEKHASFKYVLSFADLWVPDGISVVGLAKLKGLNISGRVSGADLMNEFFEVADKEGFSNYFYGDTEETLKELNQKLLQDFPNLKIAGSYSPPFRVLTEKEDEEVIEKINQAKPDVLWVGLGLPKQERWIFQHREKLNVPVVAGVGAAFKFLSGNVKRAPKWLGALGFEWLWRLFLEPKRVWKRIFVDMPIFIWLVFADFFKQHS